MKLWAGRFQKETDTLVNTFNSSIDFDARLYKQDITGSIAHATMLGEQGVITMEEAQDIIQGLQAILQDIEDGKVEVSMENEDIHMNIEALLTQRIGDAGKKIHSGRSRNDQVLVDMHLYVRDELLHIRRGVRTLFDRLIALSEQYKEVLLPGYTHLQVAMPSSFGLWFGAYAESLVDDVYLLNAAYRIADQNPLGSAAGYGFPSIAR